MSHLVTLAYIVYCLILNPQIGLFFTPVLLVLHSLSQWLVRYAGPHGTVPWALAFNFIAWFAQIVGHYGFEKNSPALMDSLVQSVLAAPIVIYLELMFSFGMLQETKTKLQRSRVVARARKSLKTSS
ncbi:putative endoplasmic reticulum membrane protein [Gracilariopsis chorda]|uniref:Putative endoplasmic reticulum membrane protein n=1 Tax=Gracilariopsis chorda TaxID=448386 RepID=A0A2V3JCA2_9FLOR|nr:putative endoplasmic reticulum membrane protein [Gracilariopsis chorda]|eukprot:PXF49960.1 putative endoplasmic reticulum membrane protein [Gracilariopsis chorda]